MPDGSTFGEHPVFCRFLKGAFELRRSLPKYTEIWDVATVLEYLKTLSRAKELSFKMLTKKVIMLLCLLTGQRCQTVYQKLPDKFRVAVSGLLKHSKPGKHQEPFTFMCSPLINVHVLWSICLPIYPKPKNSEEQIILDF